MLSLAASFVKELFVSEAQNGEAAGSELETEDVPTSVVSKGASDSGLLLGVTDGTRIGLRCSLVLLTVLPTDVLGSGDAGGAGLDSLSCDPTRFSRRTLGRERFITTILHCSSSMQRFSSCFSSLNKMPNTCA